MVGNNAVPCGEVTLALACAYVRCDISSKKLEVAREKTMPIGIRNLAILTALAATAAIVAAPAFPQNKCEPGASDTRD
jgi:hypothetical protein